MKTDLKSIFLRKIRKPIEKLLGIQSPSELWLAGWTLHPDEQKHSLPYLQMREWIHFQIEGYDFTKCPYCGWQFPQMVNSKWCPVCDQAVLLTKGMPYHNYIPTNTRDAEVVRTNKLLLRMVREAKDDGLLYANSRKD